MNKQYVIWNDTEERYNLVNVSEGFDPATIAKDEELYELLEDAEVQVNDYRALAIDREGTEYDVIWEIDEDYLKQVRENDDYFDGADACDWKYPAEVKER